MPGSPGRTERRARRCCKEPRRNTSHARFRRGAHESSERGSLPRLGLGMRSEPGFAGSATSALGPFGRGRVDCRCRRDREARARLGSTVAGLAAAGAVSPGAGGRGRGRARSDRGGRRGRVNRFGRGGCRRLRGHAGRKVARRNSVTGAAVPIGVPMARGTDRRCH